MYIYYMHGLLLYVFVLYCAQPSPQRSRIPGGPGLLRLMVIIGVQGLSSPSMREKLPFWGFRDPECLKMVAERGYTQALPCLDTPLTV